jgi:hypothetical protein
MITLCLSHKNLKNVDLMYDTIVSMIQIKIGCHKIMNLRVKCIKTFHIQEIFIF